MRLIDADYVQCRAANTFNVNRATLGEESMLWRFQQIVDEAPTVQAELAKHGQWTFETPDPVTGGVFMLAKCSECGWRNQTIKTNYCPNCGARMDGGGDGEQ